MTSRHVEALVNRHQALHKAIEQESKRPYPNMDKLVILKVSKLNLKDQIEKEKSTLKL